MPLMQATPPMLPHPPTPAKSTSPAESTTEVPLMPPISKFLNPTCTIRVTYEDHFGKFIVPPGWTARPGRPSSEYEWDGINSVGQRISRGYGLAPGRPILEDDDASTMISKPAINSTFGMCFIMIYMNYLLGTSMKSLVFCLRQEV
ncbi:hypothetical protein N7491_004431 [Penicillium cf. griseofulvum]|uniref:Uncharacterized protein n=1 Tax=Penicillium cf. griseofulvum TaxID=2972120 RepID=A0A9W9J2L4_9EURO|nr:hypothetical protein N7472_007120 [Penicillium cf. griseofulvum]KAJ5422947.1 hypothetical protein N7445_011055 [Penicillium cf. griseofulvum]KAJ5433836.1 hypothetical protein N7491_004431 [Penicillium cf. griseofulvum]